ncbi:MAG: PTS sugar transporter subunit IIA [Verrucomicrobia bacterium]|nr:PTS sugar transporter subunit IIA [Verrucomicrobiota bacterium]
MSLSNLFSIPLILPALVAKERWGAIGELVDLLVAQKQFAPEDRESILSAICQREETMSTGIGFGIAIPHASSDRIQKVVAAFGRSLEGLEFDSLDNHPVKFVVLFVVPKDQFQTHLRTLASIAKLLNHPKTRDSLAVASSAEEILAIFNDDSALLPTSS